MITNKTIGDYNEIYPLISEKKFLFQNYLKKG